MRIFRKFCSILVCIMFLIRMLVETQVYVKANNIEIQALDIIEKLVESENYGNWEEYASLWCEDEKRIYESLFSSEEFVKERRGILCVESAMLESVEIISDEYAIDFEMEFLDKYENVNSYLVGIDYEVINVSDSFFNGVNYRIIVVGEEKENIKILAVMEAPKYLLELEEINNSSKEVAIDIIEARMRGDIDVVDFPIYVKRVLPQEMTISTTDMEALKAQVICIQQFAIWNTVYYSKHPDGGYDLKDNESDQSYSDDITDTSRCYDSLLDIYKDYVDKAYAAAKNLCMVIESTGAFTIVIYSGKNNNQIWSENVGLVYGDRLSVSLYTDDKGEYILILNPEMWQGRAEYTYSIIYFDDEGQEIVDKTNSIVFDLNNSKVEDIDNIMKFAKKVNTEVFPKSYILLSTLEGKISYNEDLENKTTIQAFAPQDIIAQITMNLYNNGQK